jgi:hypothetical protein
VELLSGHGIGFDGALLGEERAHVFNAVRATAEVLAALVRQWPKNSHSRMITGIGTPTDQSNNPPPIASSAGIERPEAKEQPGGARPNWRNQRDRN